ALLRGLAQRGDDPVDEQPLLPEHEVHGPELPRGGLRDGFVRRHCKRMGARCLRVKPGTRYRPLMDRIAPTRRPPDPPAGFQRWRTLAFLHWEVPAEGVAALIPQELSVDTFEGRAWVGVVPFTMKDVSPWWAPSVPGVSNFHELNVRTYVHLRGDHPGVW